MCLWKSYFIDYKNNHDIIFYTLFSPIFVQPVETCAYSSLKMIVKLLQSDLF